MITKEAIEAAALSDAAFDGRRFDGLSAADKRRYRERSAAAITAAFAAMPGPAVKVKPLEWDELNDGSAFRAYYPLIGSVRVEPYGVCGLWEVLWSMPGQCDKLIPDVFDTPDKAKAAAQADYEARILAALEPAPDLASENDRLRAALEAINAAASKEYCASLRQFEEKECLGWESKVVSGKFGKAEHEAHKRANMLMGKAQGLWEAAKIARAALERT